MRLQGNERGEGIGDRIEEAEKDQILQGLGVWIFS